MHRFIVLLFTIILVGCSVQTDEEIGTISQASHAWSTYHWAKSSDPVQLDLSANLSGSWPSYLETASSDWNQSVVLQTNIITGTQSPKRCKAVPGRVEVCNASYGRNGWLGIAQVWVSGGHITQAVVKVNDTYFKMAKYNTVAYKHLVMCQEIGHTFGLDHQDENQNNPNLGTCMDYTNNPAGPLSNEHPNAHDYEELEIIYAHADVPVSTDQPHGRSGFVLTYVYPAD